MKEFFIIYCIYLVVLSFITFCAYGIDKRKAKKDKRRISEKTLLGLSLLGGALGGLLGMLKFRHKTRLEHWYFTLLNLVGIILHIGLLVYLFTLI
ncbi:MAG: DUF1294 domain-containing protein [Clostridiales bacterium]|nr:DUF1294 domain-containing protein [Clostridiales bacterium]